MNNKSKKENKSHHDSIFQESSIEDLDTNESLDFTDSEIFNTDELDLSISDDDDDDLFSEIAESKRNFDDSQKLKTILEINKIMNSTHELDELFNIVLDKIIILSGAEKACVIMINEDNSLDFKSFKNYSSDEKQAAEKEISKTIIFDAVAKRKAILLNDAQNADDYDSSKSILRLDIHSVICIPLLYKENPLGVLYLDNRNINQFTEDELEILELFASQAAISLKNAILIEEINRHNQKLELIVDEKSKQLINAHKNIAKQEKYTSLAHLSSGVAHYVNNMLSGIMGNAELLELYKVGHDKEINNIINLASDISKFITNLLNFSRKETAEKTENNLAELVESTLLLKKSDLINIEIEKNYSEQINYCILVNKVKITHALLNIITNTLEAFDLVKRSVKKISISIEKKADNYILTIFDNGIGIKEKNLPNVFNPLFTTKGSISGGSYESIGMGLSISQKLLEENEASITITSKQNEWTKVVIVFPLYIPE